jgi:two-component system NarL family response regulator
MRLAIVENDPVMLESLETLFSDNPEISVVGTYASSEEALYSLRRTSPEIMIVDLGLPGRSWLELIQQAKHDLPGLDIIAYALFEETDTLLSAIRAGASGYLLKGAGADDLIDAVRGLRTGRAKMSPNVAQRFIREFKKYDACGPYALTGTQRAVVSLKAEGLTCREIADQSGLSLHDVEACFKSIYVKAQIRNWH